MGHVGLWDEHFQQPVTGGDQHRQRILRGHPDAGREQGVKVGDPAVKRCGQLQSLAFGIEGGLLAGPHGPQLCHGGAPGLAVCHARQAAQLHVKRIPLRHGHFGAIGEFGLLQRKQRRAGRHRRAVFRQTDELRRNGAVQHLDMGRMGPGLTPYGPRPGQGQQCQRPEDECAQQHAARHGYLGAACAPDLQLAPDRQQDEPDDLDHEQHDAQQLEEEQVHRDRNGDEQHQAVEPDHECEGDQGASPASGHGLRVGVVPAEQGVAQGGACHGEGPFVQVGHFQRIAQDEVPVKAHEGAGIERQRHHP